MTGDQENIAKLTDAAGFRYHYDEATKQFAHASGIMVTTPQGKLSRYFYGIEYPPRDLRLGLIESSANKIGSPVDQLLLYCYHYDPATGKYGAADDEDHANRGRDYGAGDCGDVVCAQRTQPETDDVKTGGAA